ncbi:n-acetylglutamate synthase [Bisgaard Taxon 10/6]|uniref:n-acetylglutamate synthase n=1 Tax=Exercitatus varius TaxID=67857 RepID=UPI00294ACD64|nr:n-acetylglutamate synthase [Exercitatus varius]MDG2956534.1 n-acetylglutamate synthase [Exercitatus varius]MDG2964497.1 n-acetylglutamate synthase [Exercitatus varius]
MFNLNNKIFTAVQNSENGEVSGETKFYYYQQDKMIWAEYYGGEIAKGFLIGKWISENKISFTYQHLNTRLENRLGKCITEFHLDNDKLLGQESWQWLDTLETGQSQIREI